MNMLMIRKQRHLLFEWQRDSLVVLSTTTSSGGSKSECNPAMPPSRTVCQWDLVRPAGKEFYMSCRVLGNNYVVHIMVIYVELPNLWSPDDQIWHCYTSRGRRVFSGVAPPRPCLEFSLPRLGLELSASASALNALPRHLPLPRQNCLEPIPARIWGAFGG